MSTIDADRTRFVIPTTVLDETAGFLAEPGEEGFEGSALWIGHVIDDTAAEVTRAYRPEQVAYATAAGLAVMLTEDGLSQLILSLTDGEIVLSRLHTHGNGDVKHSPVDDANLVVAHPGAVSVVVPHFASRGIDLSRCGVHVLSATHRWRRLTTAETAARFTIR